MKKKMLYKGPLGGALAKYSSWINLSLLWLYKTGWCYLTSPTWMPSSRLAGKLVNCGGLSFTSVTRTWTWAVAFRLGWPWSVTKTFRMWWVCPSRSRATQLTSSPETQTHIQKGRDMVALLKYGFMLLWAFLCMSIWTLHILLKPCQDTRAAYLNKKDKYMNMLVCLMFCVLLNFDMFLTCVRINLEVLCIR